MIPKRLTVYPRHRSSPSVATTKASFSTRYHARQCWRNSISCFVVDCRDSRWFHRHHHNLPVPSSITNSNRILSSPNETQQCAYSVNAMAPPNASSDPGLDSSPGPDPDLDQDLADMEREFNEFDANNWLSRRSSGVNSSPKQTPGTTWFDSVGKLRVTQVQEHASASKMDQMTDLMEKIRHCDTLCVSLFDLDMLIVFWMSRSVLLIVRREDGGSHQRALQNALDLVEYSSRMKVMHKVINAETLSRLVRLFVSYHRSSSPDEILIGMEQAIKAFQYLQDLVVFESNQYTYAAASSAQTGSINSVDHGSPNSKNMAVNVTDARLFELLSRAIIWNCRVLVLTRFPSHPISSSFEHDSRKQLDHQSNLTFHEGLAAIVGLTQEAKHFYRIDEGNISPNYKRVFATLFKSLLSSYAHLGDPNRTRNLINELERLQPPIQLDIQNYNSVLMAYERKIAYLMYRRHERLPTDLESAQWCRNNSMEFWKSHILGNGRLESHHPVTMNTLLSILSWNPQEAQELLESMPKPTIVHFNAVINAWSKWSKNRRYFLQDLSSRGAVDEDALRTPSIHASQRVMQVLSSMNQRGVIPDTICYTVIIETLLHSKELSFLDQVDELFQRSLSSSIDKSFPPPSKNDEFVIFSFDRKFAMTTRPDSGMYLTILRGLAQFLKTHVDTQVKENICNRMHQYLNLMLEDKSVSVNLFTFKMVFSAWATSHSRLAASKVMELLESMEDHSIRPDISTLDLALRCLSIKIDPNETALLMERVKVVLEYIHKYKLRKSPDFQAQYLRLLGRSGQIEQAKSELQNSSTLDEASYFSLVEGHAMQRNGAPKAQELLQQWNGPPSLRMMCVVMRAWSFMENNPDSDAQVDLLFEQAKRIAKPALPGYFYSAYIKAVSRRPNAAALMEEQLINMQRAYEIDRGNGLYGYYKIKPNANNFASVILAWTAVSQRDETAAERAESILNLLCKLHRTDVEMNPTIACYRGVIIAWASSKHPDSGNRAISVLDRLEREEGISPDNSCYGNVLKAIGRSNDPDKARSAFDIFQRMKRSFEGGNNYVQPTTREYLAVLRTMEKARGSQSVRSEAYRLFQEVFKDWMKNNPKPSMDDMRDVYQQCISAATLLIDDKRDRANLISANLIHCPHDVLVKPKTRTLICKAVSTDFHDSLVERASRSSDI